MLSCLSGACVVFSKVVFSPKLELKAIFNTILRFYGSPNFFLPFFGIYCSASVTSNSVLKFRAFVRCLQLSGEYFGPSIQLKDPLSSVCPPSAKNVRMVPLSKLAKKVVFRNLLPEHFASLEDSGPRILCSRKTPFQKLLLLRVQVLSCAFCVCLLGQRVFIQIFPPCAEIAQFLTLNEKMGFACLEFHFFKAKHTFVGSALGNAFPYIGTHTMSNADANVSARMGPSGIGSGIGASVALF